MAIQPPKFGSISPAFGATTVDTIPSSGGVRGYTSNTIIPNILNPTFVDNTGSSGGAKALPSQIRPVTPIAVGGTQPTFNVPSSGGSSNPTQSGDVPKDPLQRIIDLYQSQFQGQGSDANLGSGVVVVPQDQSGGGGGASSPSPMVILLLLGVVAFIGYRWYQGRKG